MTKPIKNIQKVKNELLSYLQKGQYKKVEKLYSKYRNTEIHDAEFWRYFAAAHSKKNNLPELIRCCTNILKATPDDVQTLYTLGAALQNTNQIDEAIRYYEKCISIDPKYTNAIINCANLLFSTKQFSKSAKYFADAITITDTKELRLQFGEALMSAGDIKDALVQFTFILSQQPENKKALFLKAQSYYETEDYINAEKYYTKLLSLDINNINAINNLGRIYEESGQPEKAIDKYQQAINIDNRIAIIHLNMGKALIKSGNLAEAKNAFLESISLDTEHPEAYFNLGKLYNEIGETDKAKEAFETALGKNVYENMAKPDEFILAVKYFLSNLENPDLFNEDKKAFVADLFDGYADKFDKHLVDGLQYKTPELINELISKYEIVNNNNTMDLGCGTGLCGPFLKKISKNLIGIDLSEKMIQKAELLDCYDELIVGEISEIVNQRKESYDLIVAADVFVYIGSLEDIFTACTKKMEADSFFIFSTELLADGIEDDYRLYDSGRYKHATQYLNKIIDSNGFEVLQHHYCALRKENGKDVKGCVTVLKKQR